MRPLVTRLLLIALAAAATSVGAQPAPSASQTACGNHLLDPGETCEQCAADCTVQPCSPAKSRSIFAVDFTPPPAPDVTVATLRIGYRTDRLSLPGTGTAKTVQSRIKSDHGTPLSNDLDYALRLAIVRSQPIAAGRLMTIEFDRCAGAPAPTAADVSCEVLDCAGSTGNAEGCQCHITVVGK